MFAQVLRAQWKYSRAAVAVFTVLCFGAPLATVYYRPGAVVTAGVPVSFWLLGAERVGTAIPVLALLLGVVFGLGAWAPDTAGRHVYALALPLPRWHYVLLRFGAGAVLTAVPVLSLLAGSLIAAGVVTLPAGVHAYPVQLGLRFGFAVLVCFALIFTLAIATRGAVLGVLGALGGMVVADVLLGAAGQESVVLETMFRLLTTWPGPLSILIGRWALFDV